MSIKRIRIVGWLLVALLLLPTAAAARAALQPGAQTAMAAQSTVAADYYQYDRGAIVDRYGRSFTDALAPALLLFPAHLGADAAELAQLLGIGEEQLAEQVAGQQMLVLRRGLTEAQAAALMAADIAAVHLVELPQRQTSHAAWLIGSAEPPGGLEAQYDSFLQGRGGGQIAANIDARGSYCGNGLFRVAGGVGNTLCLTLDADYQQLAEQALGGQRGAIVLVDAADGALRAWAAADAEAALAAHPQAQLQPLIDHLQAACGQDLSFPPLPVGYSADVAIGEGISTLQAAQLALLAGTGRRITPVLALGVRGEQGEWLWQPDAPLPEPPLVTPLTEAHTQLLSSAAGEGGSWHIAQLIGEERLIAVVWLEGARWQARLIAETLLQNIRDLQNW